MSEWERWTRPPNRIRRPSMFTLDPATREKLASFATETGFAMSVIVEAAINRFIDEERKAMEEKP